ncbi:hypothetical protein ABT404_31170 [Streptomyces hyaluromycini]|uniref:Uncharacterized protein n=1 Tax=Streptomyces hyaluromycini TaxID=1377993 RepID=A0ABV1X4F0_9ACTN
MNTAIADGFGASPTHLTQRDDDPPVRRHGRPSAGAALATGA